MIDIDIKKRLGDFRLDASISVEASGITALFGRSGCGKTTLINSIAGLTRPDEGHIRIGGVTLFDSARGIDLAPENRRLGYVFQEGRLFPHMTVEGNLRYGMPRAGGRITFAAIVGLLELDALLDRRPATLSGGEKQRVALGRALLANPRLILMDEPLASLDAGHKDEILPFIEELTREFDLPVIYVSHAMGEIARLAQTLVLMSEGGVAAVGPVESLTSRLDLRPMTGRYEAGAVLNATVASEQPTDGLTHLDFEGGIFRVPRIDAPVGREIRVRIRARDVSIALSPPEDVSILNIFPGEIIEVGEDTTPQVDVLIDVGVPVWARISRFSFDRLGLETGKTVHVMIKAIAIDRYSLGGVRRVRRPAERPDE